MKTGKFEYLETEQIETEYGVVGMAKEKKAALQPAFTRNVVIGVTMIILGVIPLIVGSCITENEVIIVALVGLLLVMVAVAVFLFVSLGIEWETYKKLIQEDDYTPEEKAFSKKAQPIASIYWLMATAIFLGWSFMTNSWDHTWIVWPIAGVLFAVVMTAVRAFMKK